MKLIPLGPRVCAEVRGAGMADVAASTATLTQKVRAAFEETFGAGVPSTADYR